jgi:DNA-binding transcriptional LysR family regulator
VPTLRQLEYFLAVADEASFTRAAANLHVSQPGLSAQIAALERQVGGRLFERRTDGAHLTAVGRLALPHARSAVASASRVGRIANDSDTDVRGNIALATVYSISLGVMPNVLRLWRAAFPLVDVTLREHRHADELRGSMLRGEADIALGPRPDRWSGPVYDLILEQFVVLLADDPLIDEIGMQDCIPLAMLADRRWVHYSTTNGLSQVLDTACRSAGFTPKAAVRTEQTASAVALAGAGLGPTLVPENIVPQSFTGSVYRPDPPIERQLSFYIRGSGDKLLTRLISEAVPHLRTS